MEDNKEFLKRFNISRQCSEVGKEKMTSFIKEALVANKANIEDSFKEIGIKEMSIYLYENKIEFCAKRDRIKFGHYKEVNVDEYLNKIIEHPQSEKSELEDSRIQLKDVIRFYLYVNAQLQVEHTLRKYKIKLYSTSLEYNFAVDSETINLKKYFRNYSLTNNLVRALVSPIVAKINGVNSRIVEEIKPKFKYSLLDEWFNHDWVEDAEKCLKYLENAKEEFRIDNLKDVNNKLAYFDIERQKVFRDVLPNMVEVLREKIKELDYIAECRAKFDEALKRSNYYEEISEKIDKDAKEYYEKYLKLDKRSNPSDELIRKLSEKGISYTNDTINRAKMIQMREHNEQIRKDWVKSVENATTECAKNRRDNDFEIFFRDNIENMEQMKTIKCVSIEELHKWIDIFGDFYSLDSIVDNKDAYEATIAAQIDQEVSLRMDRYDAQERTRRNEEAKSQYSRNQFFGGASSYNYGSSEDIEMRDSEVRRERARESIKYTINQNIQEDQKLQAKFTEKESTVPIRYLLVLKCNNAYIDRYTLQGRDLYNKTKVKFYKHYPIKDYFIDYYSENFPEDLKVPFPKYQYDLNLNFEIYKFGFSSGYVNESKIIENCQKVCVDHESPADLDIMYLANRKCTAMNGCKVNQFSFNKSFPMDWEKLNNNNISKDVFKLYEVARTTLLNNSY